MTVIDNMTVNDNILHNIVDNSLKIDTDNNSEERDSEYLDPNILSCDNKTLPTEPKGIIIALKIFIDVLKIVWYIILLFVTIGIYPFDEINRMKLCKIIIFTLLLFVLRLVYQRLSKL